MIRTGLAIVTGADGGMGQVITAAVAKAGYRVAMACLSPGKAAPVCEKIKRETGNAAVEVYPLDLRSLASVARFAGAIRQLAVPVTLLMNNAGTMSTCFGCTEDGLENTVSVNYAGPYLLTRLLLPLMPEGSRIVNTVSCTYAIGKIETGFFEKGRNGAFFRIPVYSNTKLALLWFTMELAERLRARKISVNAADPGIVNTDIITMHQWFDPLTDVFFRPFIRTPQQGAATAVFLALEKEGGIVSGGCFAGCRQKKIPRRLMDNPGQKALWDATEKRVKRFLDK